MNLRLVTPHQPFAEIAEVLRIVAETTTGALGIWPQRLDCVAGLVPGILTYETRADGEVFVAVDEGVLVKVGPDVVVAVRRAVRGSDLGELHVLVKREFQTLDEQEQSVRSAMVKLEYGFLRRMTRFRRE